MKKIFTLFAFTAFACAASAQTPRIENNGVAQKINDNLVFYMCAPGDNKAVESPVGYNVASEMSGFEELGINFQCNDASNTNQVVVTKDYVDAETGAKFPAGYYYPTKVGGSRSYFGATAGATGIQNLKKVIFYWAATSKGGVQFSSYLVKEGETIIDNKSTGAPVSLGNRYSMDPNCKITFTVPELEGTVTIGDAQKNLFTNDSYYNTLLGEDGAPTTDWTTFACVQPLKMVLDFTTPIAKEDIDKTLAHYGENVNELVIPYGNYVCALRDENGKDQPGDAIAWAADNILQQGFKRAAYLLGIAFVSGNDDAKTYYANISESTDEDEAAWHESAEAAHADFAAEDVPEHNLFYSWKVTPEFKAMVNAYYGGTDGIENINADVKASKAVYNIAGQQVGAGFRGIVIENGVKRVK